MGNRTLLGAAGATAVALLFGAAPAPLYAQDGFLFRAPQLQFTVRAGPLVPSAQSDIFDDITSYLTVERSDFAAPFIGAEVGLYISDRFDLGLALDHAESRTRSEYRHLIGSDGLPIEQTTRLRMVPLTATMRFYPIPRGRVLGQLAWLPARTTPYLGAGGGVTWYRLHQDGEFVDESTDDIFLEEFESRDHAWTGHGAVGIDHWITPRVGLNLEGRYTRGSAPVGGSYGQFDSMDLSGWRAALGVSVRL